MTNTLTSVILDLADQSVLPLLEELVWMIDGVTSVTRKLDGRDRFEYLEVIGQSSHLEQKLEGLLNTYRLGASVRVRTTAAIEDENWAETWKQFWPVTHVLPHVVIQPSWETYTPKPNEIVLQLDPGSAFGTGSHETTQLVLLAMDECIDTQAPQTLLDMGAGSGILAIYGAKRGMATCVALDNDPEAVEVAQGNCRINGVLDNVQVGLVSEGPIQQYDLVVANIIKSVLIELMPQLRQSLALKGQLILSGLLSDQYDAMKTCVDANRMVIRRVMQKGEWLALVCEHAT